MNGAAATSAAASPAIEVTGLVKRYDGRAVVERLDLTVRPATVMAILGPNGAGKTTTLEILEGYRHADEGEVRVLGLDPWADRSALRSRVGLMLQRADLYNQIRVLEAVRLFADFYANPLSPGMVLDQVGLAARADDRYRTLSGGERQRLNVALAVIGRPELLILDEPTAAMDVAARRSTWDLLRALRLQGTTVVLATHLVEEAESLADDLAIIEGGHLVAAGTPAELRAAAGPPTESKGAAGEPSGAGQATDVRRSIRMELPTALSGDDQAALQRIPGTFAVRQLSGSTYTVSVTDVGEALVRLTEWLWVKGIEPRALEVDRLRLDEIYLRLTAEDPGREA